MCTYLRAMYVGFSVHFRRLSLQIKRNTAHYSYGNEFFLLNHLGCISRGRQYCRGLLVGYVSKYTAGLHLKNTLSNLAGVFDVAKHSIKHSRKFGYELDTVARNLGELKLQYRGTGIYSVRPVYRTEHSGIVRDEIKATVPRVALEQNVASVGSPMFSADDSHSAIPTLPISRLTPLKLFMFAMCTDIVFLLLLRRSTIRVSFLIGVNPARYVVYH